MSMRRTIEHVGKKCSPASDKFKQLIADAYMTLQGTRGARHCVQPLQKHHYVAKESMKKIHKKRESCRRFLTASRMMKNFMQGRHNIIGQENGVNIWITLEQPIFCFKPSFF